MRKLTREISPVPADLVYDSSQPFLGRSKRVSGSAKLRPKFFQLLLEFPELMFSRSGGLSGHHKGAAALANGYVPTLLKQAECLTRGTDRYPVLPRKLPVRRQLLVGPVLTCVDRR